MKTLFTFILILLSFSLVFSQKNYSTSEAPPNYQPNFTQLKSFSADADILLVQTSLPWDSYANTKVLNQLGYTYNIVDMSNIDNTNLFDYPVILIVNDQTQTFYNQYADQKSDFEEYVRNGGSLLFFAASDGWAKGTLNANLPGNVEVITPHYEYNNFIKNSQHPIVTGILSDNAALINYDLYNYYCSHGYFKSYPQNTDIILVESHNYPTLIEYKIGRGKVIASTLTWEHAYSYYDDSREFSRKALDDVFLYMFSEGYSPISSDVDVELRVEDANPNIMVNKIEGTFVDVIAKISNNSNELIENSQLILTVNNDEFYDEIKVYKRDGQSDLTLDEDVNDVLNPLIGSIPAKTSGLEFVFRFKIKEDAIPDKSISIDILDIDLNAELKSNIVQKQSNKASIRILERGPALIVTNRKLLYEKYDDNEVNSLLAKIYEISEFGNNEFPGVVYYVERYSDLAENWEQDVDYTQSINEINKVANDIDKQIEIWYNHQKKTLLPLPVGVAPGYLAIIGGDEIIPFYRVNNSDYCSDSGTDYNDVYKNNYFLTDNTYADTDNSFSDAEKGELEMAVGRIIGHSAKTMQKFLENASKGPELLETALVTSFGPLNNMNVDEVIDALEDQGANILGKSKPDLIGNDNWTANELYTELQKDFQVFNYMAHANPNTLTLVTGPQGGELNTWDLKKDELMNFESNNPFVSLMACNSGVIMERSNQNINEEDGCFPYKMAQLGVSGFLAPTSIAYYAPFSFSSQYGEELINLFYKGMWGSGNVSNKLGLSLINAKKRYDIGLTLGRKTDKKTLLEFAYYGLPWTTIESKKELKSAELQELVVSIDTLNYKVEEYLFEEFEGYEEFELLTIPDCEYLNEELRPIVPYFSKTVWLPKNTNISGVEILDETALNLGVHQIPQTVSSNMEDEIQYNTDYEFEVYPEQRIIYEKNEFEDHDELVIYYIPVSIDGNTKEVTLYTETKIAVEAEFSSNIIIKNFSSTKTKFGIGEPIDFNVTLLNNDTTNHDIQASITISGVESNTVNQTVTNNIESSFTIQWTELLSEGYYDVILKIYDTEQNIIGNATIYINVLSGKIENFNFPDTIIRNNYSEIGIEFMNYETELVSSSGYIEIYDESNKNIANLIKQSLNIESDSTGNFIWNWKTIELKLGNYSARAYVEVDNKIYGPIEKDFVVEKSIRIGSIIPDTNPILLCSQSNLVIEVQLKDSSSVIYRWYHDTSLLENYNDSILHINDFTEEDEGGYYCIIYNEFDTISTDTIHVFKNYVFEISEEINICGGDDYNGWMVSGEYVRNLTSLYGCDSIVTTNLTVNPVLIKPVITQVMDTLFSDAETGNQWYFNGELLTGETNNKLYADKSGDYFVVVTNEQGCNSEQSETITLWLTSSKDVPFSDLKIYPNPTNNVVIIENIPTDQQVIITLCDVFGKEYLNILSNQSPRKEIDLQNIANGIYFIKISGFEVGTYKIIKN